MLQRIQSVYLALAVILLVLCCCMPLALFEPEGMGFPRMMYSLVAINADGAIESYLPTALLLILVFAELFSVLALMGYKNRKKQMSMCSITIIIELLWVICYAGITFLLKGGDVFRPELAACFPVIAMILTIMARRAIKKDDDLVRSADRIR